MKYDGGIKHRLGIDLSKSRFLQPARRAGAAFGLGRFEILETAVMAVEKAAGENPDMLGDVREVPTNRTWWFVPRYGWVEASPNIALVDWFSTKRDPQNNGHVAGPGDWPHKKILPGGKWDPQNRHVGWARIVKDTNPADPKLGVLFVEHVHPMAWENGHFVEKPVELSLDHTGQRRQEWSKLRDQRAAEREAEREKVAKFGHARTLPPEYKNWRFYWNGKESTVFAEEWRGGFLMTSSTNFHNPLEAIDAGCPDELVERLMKAQE